MCACAGQRSNCSGCNCQEKKKNPFFEPLLPYERFSQMPQMAEELKVLGLAGSQWNFVHPGNKQSYASGDEATVPASTEAPKPSFLDKLMGYVPVLSNAAATVVGAKNAPAPTPEKTDNTILYLGIGVAVIVVGLIGFVIWKKNKKN